MGISITRVVKFIRMGERGNSVITAVTPIRRYNLAAWQKIGSNDYSYSWANISNAANFKTGDTIVINGVVTDKEDVSIMYYGEVVSTKPNTNVVTALGKSIIISGTNGSSFMAQYSIDGKTNWHTTFTDGDIYMRTSADSGKTWSNAIRIVGEKGGETNYAFAWSSHATLDDSEDPLSDVVDWEDYPPKQPDGKPYLWTMITTPDGKVSYARLTGEKGERGAVMRGPQAWSDCAVGYNFQAGADGEEFKDIVMYGSNYYSCIKSHTKTASNNPTSTIDTNNGYWKSADKVEIIATKILLAQYALVKNLGVEAIDMKDSAGNIIFQAKDGNVICNSGTFKNGTFQNVKIIGSLRNPFTYANGSMDTNYNDNVAMISYGGGWMTAYSLPWDVSQSGRKISIVNYRWGSETAEGQAAIDAPSGKYFFEDGLQKSQLRISREIIELIGYGTSTEFYGWIVVNRIDLMPTQRYGHCLKVLAYGTCAGSDTTAKTSLIYTTFDGSKLSVTRQSTGIYRITYPSNWFNGTSSNCRVIPTGRGNILNGSNPIKANLHSIGTNYFEVSVSDDESRNDGSFDFIVYNGSDFDIL